MPDTPTPDDYARGHAALATALGVALAAHRDDRTGIAALWDGAGDRDGRIDVLVQLAMLLDNAVQAAGYQTVPYLEGLAAAVAADG